MRRIRGLTEVRPEPVTPEPETAEGSAERTSLPLRPDGPLDVSEADPAAAARLDLGCLLVAGLPEVEIRLEVEPQRQSVVAVTFIRGQAAAQVQLFAAPRTRSTWPEVADALRAQITGSGGKVHAQQGPYGEEIQTVVRAGETGTQPARLVGIAGPRWLLRVTYLGAAATPGGSPELEQMVRSLIVVRGSQPLAPGEQVPFRAPAALTASP